MQNLTSKPSKTERPYDPEDWKRGYGSQPNEYDYAIADIDGTIPPDLEGTLFRNGPGLLDIGGLPIHHPFDGDGMISAIAFRDGRAHYRNRYVRTPGYLEEQKAQTIRYRGVFGTQKPGGWLANAFDLRTKNIANTQVIYWGGKLLALWEAAQPHRLDPETLETLGIDDLGGILEPGEAFAAHPRIDPRSQFNGGEPSLVNFAIKPGLSTTITIYELAPDGGLVHKHDHSVPGFAFIHDFAITPNYCIFLQNPVRFNPLPYLFGLCGAGQCINFQPNEPTRAIVIPRDPKRRSHKKVLEIESGFVFHHVNAFETGDEIYLDSICYESLPGVDPQANFRDTDFTVLEPGQLWRFNLNLTTGEVKRQMVESRCCEFPTIHPDRMGRSYRYLYLGAAHQPEGNAPLQGVLKVDLETGDRQLWSAAPRGFAGEPVFVPRPDGNSEDDGWVLMLVYNSETHQSDVVILDGKDVNQGPVARLHLKHHIPYGLHGTFAKL
ncbi:carotenoid oxygenase family protein [Lyngbya sp. CCY1209]|uniref:carotenoid oxygenase family protein n=1 Tax=Lyngbya sp. CCY1209 TaxID=2886103 RepID=UPI002D202813|nr:carotenoid oxygenase family protein [Lyngbya sp. CCY1209]MEB3883453.1 carotenoid oxygenase family protein [Lyngbya sp. CCY1209]